MSKMENATFAATKCDISHPDADRNGWLRAEKLVLISCLKENMGTRTEEFGGINISWDGIMVYYDDGIIL